MLEGHIPKGVGVQPSPKTPNFMTMTMTKIEKLNWQIDRLAAKRNQAADKMGNVILAFFYQQEIDKLVEELNKLNTDE
jgi:hypothetical protein